MDKKALVILADGFEEIEAVSAIDILRRSGIKVVTAGLTAGEVTGSHGIKVLADTVLEEAELNFDACVLPGGGKGADNLASSQKLKSILEVMDQNGKVIAAICASPAVVLSGLELLKGKNATCYPGMEERFAPETTFVAANVIIDGNIITSRAAGTAVEFSLAIVESLAGKETREKVKKSILA